MLTKYSAVSSKGSSSRPSQAAIRRMRVRRSANDALVHFCTIADSASGRRDLFGTPPANDRYFSAAAGRSRREAAIADRLG